MTTFLLSLAAVTGAEAKKPAPVEPQVLRGPFLFLTTPYFEDGSFDAVTLAAEAR